MYTIENIRAIRLIKGYSQKGIAKKLGISQQAYSKIENKQTKITEKQLREILKALHSSNDELKKVETVFLKH